MPNANRSNVYRTLVCFGINRVPQEKKQQASTFKEYEPGYLHIDVTYFPKSLPLSHFPQTVPTLPFIRPFVRLRRHILHQHLFLIQPMV
jgi:hypothetical protein